MTDVQISPTLRQSDRGYSHWCPGCEEMHLIPYNWFFSGNLDSPRFTPSVKIGGKLTVKIKGKWTGEWVRDADGNAVDRCCHYVLTAGQLQFCQDSTHALSNRTVALPPLPDGFRDP